MILNGFQPTMAKCRATRRQAAFTLLEVMFATAIFFAAMFGVLALMSQNLRSAQLLRQASPHSGVVAAQVSVIEQLESLSESGDFGELYPDYAWHWEAEEVATNGLWRVDVAVFRRAGLDSEMSVLFFRPRWSQQASRLR